MTLNVALLLLTSPQNAVTSRLESKKRSKQQSRHEVGATMLWYIVSRVIVPGLVYLKR